jgi:hypothetical protein
MEESVSSAVDFVTKEVSFARSPKDKKLVKLLHMIDPPGKTICCCDVSKKSGVPKMCALPVAVGKAHCVDFKTHAGKAKAENIFSAFFITEMGRGREGLVAYTTKCIGEEKVPAELLPCFEDESKSKGSWVKLINDRRVRAVVGSEAKADARKVLFAGGESSVLKAVFTPKKIKVSPRPGSVHESGEDDLWERLGFKPSSPPHLRDLGPVIEVMAPLLLLKAFPSRAGRHMYQFWEALNLCERKTNRHLGDDRRRNVQAQHIKFGT